MDEVAAVDDEINGRIAHLCGLCKGRCKGAWQPASISCESWHLKPDCSIPIRVTVAWLMLKCALLGFLNYRPRSGYDLKQLMDVSTSNFWHAKQSQIYATLKKMEKDGLILSHIHPQESRQHLSHARAADQSYGGGRRRDRANPHPQARSRAPKPCQIRARRSSSPLSHPLGRLVGWLMVGVLGALVAISLLRKTTYAHQPVNVRIRRDRRHLDRNTLHRESHLLPGRGSAFGSSTGPQAPRTSCSGNGRERDNTRQEEEQGRV